MRKSTIPVAVVLAASAVPVQAQDAVDYTKEQLQEEVSKLATLIGTYPEAIQESLLVELSAIQQEVNKLSDESTDEDKSAILEKLSSLKTKAKDDQQPYADARDAAIKAKAEAQEALESAKTTIGDLDIPSVREDYLGQLDQLSVPEWPDDESTLYENQEYANSIKSAWESYKTQIDELVSAAQTANSTEKENQDTRERTLTSKAGELLTYISGEKDKVEKYIDCSGVAEQKTIIEEKLSALTGIVNDGGYAALKVVGTLTESVYNKKDAELTQIKTAVAAAVEAAETAAFKAAQQVAADMMDGYEPYDPVGGGDKKITAAKQAVNDAIAEAQGIADNLAETIDKESHDGLVCDLTAKLEEVDGLKEAVTTAQNNYDAYQSLVSLHKDLKAAYNASAIELSTMQSNGVIDSEFYNEANSALNDVATKLDALETANDGHYANGEYESGEEDLDYLDTKDLLGEYTTAKAITQIVEKAKTLNEDLTTINGYRESVDAVNVALTSEKYQVQADVLNDELSEQKDAVVSQIDELEADLRANKALDTDKDAAVQSAIAEFKNAAEQAETDLAAYESSSNTIDGWNKTYNDILEVIILDDRFKEADADAYQKIYNDSTSAESIKAEIDALFALIESAFNAEERRTIEGVWSEISESDISDRLADLLETAKTDMEAYKAWAHSLGDKVAYEQGKAYYTELETLLQEAKDATSADAKGFSDDEKDIAELKNQVESHPEHSTNDCIALLGSWHLNYLDIKNAIDAHKKAYIANGTTYADYLSQLEDIKNDDLYNLLNDENKGDIVSDIDTQKAVLEQKNEDQDASSYEISVEVGLIKNSIAQKVLDQKFDLAVTDAITAAKTAVTENDGWNPSEIYTTELDNIESKDVVELQKKIASAEYKDYETLSGEIRGLIAKINDVPTKAEANYNAYSEQKQAQDDAKAVWADIYSKVGAMYSGEEFAGAQAYYQNQLNENLTEINNFDEEIEKRYNAGTSVEFGKDAYDEAIAKNEEAMNDIKKAASDNLNAYNDQIEMITSLESLYDTTKAALEDQLLEVQDAIDNAGADATEDVQADLEQQKADLEVYLDQLEDIKTNNVTGIDALKPAATVQVNAGNSVTYVDEYKAWYDEISSSIKQIAADASGVYDENIVDHNEIIKQLFDDAYEVAKKAYHDYVFMVDEYAGYKHALDESGNSAYASAIEAANQEIFRLNTELVDEYNAAYEEFNADGSSAYTDKEQVHKGNVNTIKENLDEAYDVFLNATQQIADDNDYARPLYVLSDAYDATLADIKNYQYKDDAMKAFDDVDGGSLSDKYDEDKEAYTGPQALDDLLSQVKNLTDAVNAAYNTAANTEATKHIEAAEAKVAEYEAFVYPSSITDLADAITAAKERIEAADNACQSAYADGILPTELQNVLDYLNGIEESLSEAKDAADAALGEAKAEWVDTYNDYKEQIVEISQEIETISSDYADELNELIEPATGKVAEATTANDNAYNKLYEDGVTTVETAISNAQKALDELKEAYQNLVDNTPAGIVQVLLNKAQELVPLYNRAEANANYAENIEETKAKCEAIYADLTSLLTALQPDENAEDYADKIQEIADSKAYYESVIEDLKNRIVDADVEQQAYAMLLDELAPVKEALADLLKTVVDSEFANELNDKFSAELSDIEKSLDNAEQQINIDHANNLCGKDGAVVDLDDISTIAASIETLKDSIDAEEKALAKAKADKELRDANDAANVAAKAAIQEAKAKLDTDWAQAQRENVDVFYLFNAEVNGEEGLYAQLYGLSTTLEEAYNAAQNVDGDPSALNTTEILASVETISTSIDNLMQRISARQAQYNTDVETLNANIKEMKANYDAVEISDIAKAEEDVQNSITDIETAIAGIDAKMENLGPNDIEAVQGQIDAANALIEALADLAAGKTYVPGDISGDGTVNVLDLSLIRDLVSGKKAAEELEENQAKAADMDKDGEYTVADLVQINNIYVFGNKYGQNVAAAKAAMKADVEPGSMSMQMDTDNMDVMLNSSTGYAALQMDVVLPAGVNIREVDFAGESTNVMVTANVLENGSYRIVLYTVDGSNMLNGENRLLNLKLAGEGTGVVSIDNIIASTGAGVRHNLDAVSGAYTIVTGIESVETTEGNSSVFGTDGVVRRTLQKGINIVKDAAGKVKKVLVK